MAGKLKLTLVAALAFCITAGMASTAMAAALYCGACHGTTPANADNCTNTGRGLHGTHVNYSSATFKKTVASNGKCAYCHTAVSDTTGKLSTTHINGYLNITGGASAMATGLTYSVAAGTCTNACHKNDTTGKWGNYTAVVVGSSKLSCKSCHEDITNKFNGKPGAHNKHLLSNVTTPNGLMSAAANAGCAACHPNQVNDLWLNGKADDGTKKAYPHAQDGTNVVADNAVLAGSITGATKNGTSTTCTNNCHKNTSSATWGGTLACDACHYYAVTPTFAGNSSATTKLGGAHSTHFKSGSQYPCTTCHNNRTDNTHASSLPPHTFNAVVVKASMTFNAGKTCYNTGAACHGVNTTTPNWYGGGGSGCALCHNYPGGSADWTTGNAHAVKYSVAVAPNNTHLRDNASYNFTTDTYSSVTTNKNKCGLCHSGGTHQNGTINVVGSGNGACLGANFTVSVVTTGVSVTCSDVSCHNGIKTPNWW